MNLLPLLSDGATARQSRSRHDQQSVEARLLDLQPKHVANFQSLWQAQLRQFSQADKYWDSAFKERLTIHGINYEGYAIEYEGCTQGLMMLETQWRSS